MNYQQVIQTFTDFFTERQHHLIPSASLVPPPGDPVLFTSAGMHPLTPYLEGRPHPAGGRLVDVQRCLRTTDLDEVGDRSHLTVFEMLGSWSLGDYPGTQSVRWGLELVRDRFGIPVSRLYATVYGGPEYGGTEPSVGPDTDLIETWTDLGVPVELSGTDNWWSNGPTGLCGTDSELFVWMGDGPPQGTPGTDRRWLELWNHVLLSYWRLGDGRLKPLDQPNVDTGMGLERLLTVLQGTDSVFGTDLLQPWTAAVSDRWPLEETKLRLVTDHLRSSVVVLGDGVRPSNTGRGYVLRRLIRRALTELWQVDPSGTLEDLPSGLITGTLRHFGQDGPAGGPVDGLVERPGGGPGEQQIRDVLLTERQIRDVLLTEQQRFGDLLSRGREVLRRRRGTGPLTEADYRYLHETHGLPREFVTEPLEREGRIPG